MAEEERSAIEDREGDGSGRDGSVEAQGFATEYEDVEAELSVQGWLDENRIAEREPHATLYRYLDEKGTRKENIDYYTGVIPEKHEIGIQHGAGFYLFILHNGGNRHNQKATTFRFRMGKAYDEKHANYIKEKATKEREALSLAVTPPPAAPVPAPVNGNESLIQAFGMIQAVMAQAFRLFEPLISASVKPTPALPPPSQGTNPMADYALSRKIMAESLKDNLALMADISRKYGRVENMEGLPEEEGGKEEKEAGLFEKIIELAAPFVNILAQNSLAGKAAAAAVKAAPAFKEVVNDTALAKRVIEYFDAKEGKTKADMALKNLGIDRGRYTGENVVVADRLPPAVRRSPVVPQSMAKHVERKTAKRK